MHNRYLQSNAFHWTLELVGSPKRLLVNITILIAMGFGILSSQRFPILMFFFGGLIPIIFNYCVYSLATVCLDKAAESSLIPRMNIGRMRLFFGIDIAIIVVLLCLILTDVLSSWIFKVIACPLLPTIQLLGLRGLLVFYLT